MSAQLLAEFADSESLQTAARRADASGHRLLDVFTPFPIEEMSDLLEVRSSRLRWVMLAAGLAVAGFFYWLQWWSAAVDYPLNVGGQPLNSWPVFLLVPFEVGMLAAAIAGLVALFWACGLPRLHHSVFGVATFERASQDRFFLLAEALGGREEKLRALLHEAGAQSVLEVRP